MTDSTSSFGTYPLEGWKKSLHKTCTKLGTNWTGKRLTFIFRKIVMLNHLPSTIIDESIEGFSVRFYPFDNVTDRSFLFFPRFFDPQEQEFMQKVLHENSNFIDVGGNSGLYALFASRRITSGSILTFEPHPEMAQRLLYNIKINGLSDRVVVKNYGIADANKNFSLSINPKNMGGNSIALTHEDKADYLTETVQVPCRLLYNVLQEENIDAIDLLKIDIEEAEHLALLPFFNNVPENLYPKHIIIETDDKVILENFGYRKLFTTKSHNSVYSLDTHG